MTGRCCHRCDPSRVATDVFALRSAPRVVSSHLSTDPSQPSEVVGSQHYRPIGLRTFKKPDRGPFFNPVSQSHELIQAMIRLYVSRTIQPVQRRTANRTANDLALISHREFKNHSIGVVILNFSAFQ
jgi:hypothetical protein